MTKITNKIDRLIPTLERTILFDQDDAVAGDILMVEDSLGRPGRHVNIDVDAGGSLTVDFNVLQTVFPNREFDTSLMYTAQMPNVSLGQEVTVSGVASIAVGASESWSQDNEFPVKSIKILSESGDWEILVS
jgi:hypothetical protein